MIKKKTNKSKTPLIVSIFAVILIVGIVFWVRHINNSVKPAQISQSLTSNSSNSNPSPTQATPSAVPQTTPTPDSDVPGGLTGSGVTSQAVLVAPSGEFVSSHSAHLSDTEQSSCTTT